MATLAPLPFPINGLRNLTAKEALIYSAMVVSDLGQT